MTSHDESFPTRPESGPGIRKPAGGARRSDRASHAAEGVADRFVPDLRRGAEGGRLPVRSAVPGPAGHHRGRRPDAGRTRDRPSELAQGPRGRRAHRRVARYLRRPCAGIFRTPDAVVVDGSDRGHHLRSDHLGNSVCDGKGHKGFQLDDATRRRPLRCTLRSAERREGTGHAGALDAVTKGGDGRDRVGPGVEELPRWCRRSEGSLADDRRR